MELITGALIVALWHSLAPLPGSQVNQFTSPPTVRSVPSAAAIRDAIVRGALAMTTVDRLRAQAIEAPSPKRSWIERHPACFGAAVGFVAGFVIGFLPGDDGIIDDYSALGNGLIVGGFGAGAGAVIGSVQGRSRQAAVTFAATLQ